jgi:hypothetical protein
MISREDDAVPTAPGIDLERARSVIADVRVGRSTLARAAASLGIAPDQLPTRRDERALAIYRAYVGAVVQTASPLLFQACALNGLALDEVVLRLRPGVRWEHWLCGTRPRDAWCKGLAGQTNAAVATPALHTEWALQEWLHVGVVLRSPERRLPMIGIRVLASGVEMAAALGKHRLRTHGNEGSITLRMELPATVATALPGIALDRFIDHPLLAGAGCVITAVDERTRWGAKVRFTLRPVPWRLPWAR